jgi:hypothetical protein
MKPTNNPTLAPELTIWRFNNKVGQVKYLKYTLDISNDI